MCRLAGFHLNGPNGLGRCGLPLASFNRVLLRLQRDWKEKSSGRHWVALRPKRMTGLRSIARWMLDGNGRRAHCKFLYSLATPTVSLSARRPDGQEDQ